MLGNFPKIAFRNLAKNRAFTTINVLGLSLGLSCCMLLTFYIQHQLSFDRHQEHAENLYLVGAASRVGDDEKKMARISAPYAFALKEAFPEVEQASRLYVNTSDAKALLQVREEGKAVQSFYQDRGYQVDSTFFDLFTYRFTEGTPQRALKMPNAIVLSEEVAQKLFGDAPALNKVIQLSGTTGNSENFTVAGVYEADGNPSHIDARFFVPIQAGWVGGFLRNGQLDFINNNLFYTYVRLRPGADPRQLEQKLVAFMEKHARADLKAMGAKRELFLVPVPDLHFFDRFQAVVTPTSSRAYVYILASIALFILLIACVNFMNLATALSVKRAAEVGIRKVLGAERWALIRQFLVESVLLSVVALVVSFWLIILLLPLFNNLTGNSFAFAELLSPASVAFFICLTILTGLLAGIYPALFLSGYKPVQVLKGKFANSLSTVSLRKALVVFQFVIAICLMLSTFIIEEQMQYLKNKPLGFAQDQQLVIPLRSEKAKAAYAVYRDEILRHKDVLAASGTSYYPGIANNPDWMLHTAETGKEHPKAVYNSGVDFDYLQTMGFELLNGRLFSREFTADTVNSIVVNEAALAAFGIPADDAIGKMLLFSPGDQTYNLEIIGVVRNFHFKSLHQPIEPYLFYVGNSSRFNYLVANANPANMDQVLAHLEQKWQEISPEEPFEFTFLNEDFQKNYQAEQQTALIVRAFTATAILISCLGLFGLAAFSAHQRTKEIGVRKVLGASVTSIVGLLSKDFLKLVLGAIFISMPIAWYAMTLWLADFTYRITVPWWVFVITSCLTLAIAFVTVSFQAIKAALMNPVKSLRSE